MVAVHWLNTVGAQSPGKEENPEYGAREFLTAAARNCILLVRVIRNKAPCEVKVTLEGVK